MNAAILVARTLVRTQFAESSTEYGEAVERARYCQLLASRCRLPVLAARRLHLAAWISVLGGNEQSTAMQMLSRYGIEDILFPSRDSEEPQTESDILGLVRCYQGLKAKQPALAREPAVSRKLLRALWASSPGRRGLLRKLIGLLKDEILLMAQPVAGGAGRILIVDPEESVVPVLSPALRARGYTVNVADAADVAEEMIGAARPDLIVAEMDMPLVDGLELCRRLKSDPATGEIPLFFATKRRGRSALKEAARVGAEDVLTKPVDIEFLLIKISKINPAAPAAVPAGGEGTVRGSLADLDFVDMIQIICAGSKSMVISLMSGMRSGEVHVKAGEVVHAQVGETQGDAAFYELMTWKEGTFAAAPATEFPLSTVDTPVMSLLMEGARLADEAAE